MNAFVSDQRRSFTLLGLIVAAAVVLLDQLSKWWILEQVMQPVPHVIEVTSFFNLVLVWNYGVSFGTFASGGALMPYVLSAIAAVIAVCLVFWLRQAERLLVGLAIGLIIGGAVGNVVDRLRFGAVVDFLDFHAGGWHFWAFNVADSGISVGVLLLLLDGLFAGREKS
ncbi:signal peptidase II [Azospirillum picis]|uniref:Lipoprotein signal peptidase n=1 Tax=Azospirillum picis TaxID=488438 RepID=A0ABU0MF45_9PROT|nr:signal peptidase II [Azospirillum picis]MBP2298222.1 signal peptidase II [Azospirillum picis]MDQ0532060.1 signal peptidase II [Azospirillum picis]